MKRFTFCFITTLFTCFIIKAQPAINASNMPLVGDSVVIAICSDPVEPGPAGADQTWDMNALNESEEGYFTFISPSETLWDYHFPIATVCGRSWTNSFTFYKTSATTFEQLGACLLIDTIAPPNDTAKSIYSDGEELLNFPFEINDMFTDDFAGTNYVFGFTQAFEGDITVEADGYGTLILPNGTFNNVIRYHFTRNQTAAFSPPQFKEQWGWISADNRFWLLLMETLDDGFSTSSLVWYNKAPIAAIPTTISTQIKAQINLYPNPVSQNELVYIDWNKAEEVNIEITDISGSIIFSGNILFQNGSNVFDLSNKLKSAGIYFINITAGGIKSTERLVIME